MIAYYNEHDPEAAAWLRELIKRGLIALGDVDERDIWDVVPTDVMGYRQCHWCAGIGAWSYALRRAGWDDDRPVWTGSCPCTPFSAAGKRLGFADERHLWPAWFHLISECRPGIIFSEQVESDDGIAWLDLVWTDLEAAGYAFGPVVVPAAGLGAPHARHRIWFVAESDSLRRDLGAAISRPETRFDSGARVHGSAHDLADADGITGRQGSQINGGRHPRSDAVARAGPGCGGIIGIIGIVGHTGSVRLQDAGPQGSDQRRATEGPVSSGTMADPECERWSGGQGAALGRVDDGPAPGRVESVNEPDRGDQARPGSERSTGPTNGFWRDADWLRCRDGLWRVAQPGSFPLVNGTSRRLVRGSHSSVAFDANATSEARVLRLRGYGNAINAAAAEAFIRAYLGNSKG